MEKKIKVYGKAQNRTVLGIMHAYMTMYPHATLADICKAFPKEICPDSGTQVKNLFVPLAEAEAVNTKANMSLFFVKPDETLTMGNGEVVALVQVWTKASFERAVSQAELYGIEVADFEKGAAFQKGGFRLEYLNGYVPKEPVKEQKKNLLWLWILLGVLALAGILWFALGGKKTEVVEKEVIVEKKVVVRDTVFVQQIEEIERNFNAAQFEKGKAELNDDAKLALHDLAKIMTQNKELRLRIEGYTSAEGDASLNQKLSEERAQAAVDFLVNKEGIDASRLTAAGYGSSKPVSENPEENRRTEFKIEK